MLTCECSHVSNNSTRAQHMDQFKVETDYAHNTIMNFDGLREIHSSYYAEKRIFIEATACLRGDCTSVIIEVDRIDDDDAYTYDDAVRAKRHTIEAYEVTNEDDLRTLLTRLLHRYLTTIDLSV
jgi:hypothetical protein